MDIYELHWKETARQQEKQLEACARKAGCWFGDESQIERWNFIGSGCEARVYEDEDPAKIRKVINYSVSCDSPSVFFDERVVLYNLLFPETAYELLGFARWYGDFCFVVKQSFIEGVRLEMEEIQGEMTKRGFMSYGYKYVYDRFVVEDLHQGNVLKDKRGNLFVIDAIPSFVSRDQPNNRQAAFNSYYLQRRAEMLLSVACMQTHPLSLQKKREQTDLILNSLYL